MKNNSRLREIILDNASYRMLLLSHGNTKRRLNQIGDTMNKRQLALAKHFPKTSTIYRKRSIEISMNAPLLCKFRVNTELNRKTTVWLTTKGYKILDTANGWYTFMSEKYIQALREQKQIA